VNHALCPKENSAINETWASDRDRFSFEGLSHSDRIINPRMKVNGRWQEVNWREALEAVALKLKKIISEKGADEIAGLASANSTIEEFYLFQKLLRSLGSNHIDHRLRQQDFSDQDSVANFPGLNMNIADIEKSDAFLLVGSDIRNDAPLIGHRINKAVQEEAKAFVINLMDHQMTFTISDKLIAADIIFSLAQVAKALTDLNDKQEAALLQITPSESAKNIAQEFNDAKAPIVFVGLGVVDHPSRAVILQLAQQIAELSNGHVCEITQGANTAGAWIAGAIPHRDVAGGALKKEGLTAKA
ncbi:unnamed protein product, partial [marine sediment metagenome]